MEKALPLFKKLDGIAAAELVYFYDEFQRTASVYLLPFMSFDAISIMLGFEGLCPPGMLEECNPVVLVLVLMLVLVGQPSAGACVSKKLVLLAFLLSICHSQNYEEKHGEMMI